MAPGFQTSVTALSTLRAASVQKWSLYENGKKFRESGKKVRKQLQLVWNY